MKIASTILFILSIGLIGYGYWGAFTNSGNKLYDEMDAYYPFFMLIAGLILLVVSLIMAFLRRRKKKRFNL